MECIDIPLLFLLTPLLHYPLYQHWKYGGENRINFAEQMLKFSPFFRP